MIVVMNLSSKHGTVIWLAGVLGLTPMVQAAENLPNPGSLADEIAAAKRAGLPTVPSDIQVRVRTDENAAPLYRELGRLLKARPLTKADEGGLSDLGARHNPSDAAVMAGRRLFARRNDIADLIRRATDRPRCAFKRDWALGANLQFPEFRWMRFAARWLGAERAMLLRGGNYMEAIRRQARGFRLSQHAASDPIIIAYLVAVAIDNITFAGFEKILNDAGEKPGIASEVRRTIEKKCSAVKW